MPNLTTCLLSRNENFSLTTTSMPPRSRMVPSTITHLLMSLLWQMFLLCILVEFPMTYVDLAFVTRGFLCLLKYGTRALCICHPKPTWVIAWFYFIHMATEPHHLFLAVSNTYFVRRTQCILLYSISPPLLIIFKTHLHSIHISQQRFIQHSSQNLLSGLNWIGFFLIMHTGTSLPNM